MDCLFRYHIALHYGRLFGCLFYVYEFFDTFECERPSGCYNRNNLCDKDFADVRIYKCTYQTSFFLHKCTYKTSFFLLLKGKLIFSCLPVGFGIVGKLCFLDMASLLLICIFLLSFILDTPTRRRLLDTGCLCCFHDVLLVDEHYLFEFRRF
jgi:hypothetical protein